ncbi:MAG: efflux RND transporter permease subunit, partial [Bacteroidales bacterium]
AFNLTVSDIASKIEDNNRSVSGGKVSDLGLQYIVKGVSNLKNTEDFEDIVIGYRAVEKTESDQDGVRTGKAPVYLKDLAEVEFVNETPDNIVRVNGARCIGLSVYKEANFNTVSAVDNVTKQLDKIKKALPGYEFQVISNQGTFIKSSIDDVKGTALLGIVLAIVVLFVFLRRFGTTLIVSIAIPISLVATFNLMYFGGLTLNIMTLGGMALGAGMLVDNAIVVIESIFRNQKKETNVSEAAIEGTSQVAGAVIASTLTTIVVFLPIVYMHGASGELFKDQAWTVAFSLLSSLFVAIFIIPMLYTKLIGKRIVQTEKAKDSSIQFNGYGRFLRLVLNKKGIVLLISLVVLIVTFACIPLLKTEFIPKTENSTFVIEVKLQDGMQIDRTVSTVEGLEKLIHSVIGDSSYVVYSHIGKNAGDQSSVFEGENTAFIKVALTDEKLHIEEVINQLALMTDRIEGVEVNYKQEDMILRSMLDEEDSPIVVEVKGEDLKEIERLTEEIKAQLAAISDLYNVKTSIENGNPEVTITLDRKMAGMYNLSIASVIEQIKQQLSGKSSGVVDYEGESRNIEIRLPDVGLADLTNIRIRGGDKEFQLSEIAQIEKTHSPKEIIRRNQVRLGKVMANMNEGISLEEASLMVNNALHQIETPANYTIALGGQEQKRKEAMRSMLFTLMLSIALVYMVLASQFESLLHPFTILLTIPLAVVGAILGFFITNTTVNIMGVIGIVMLVGIAVNNSILLVDRMNQLKLTDRSLKEIIIEAGEQRIRPIFMTTITTILALLPLTFGFGDGAALRAPMAIAVIGGLISSTAMSLIVIPCLYLTFENIKRRRRGSI